MNLNQLMKNVPVVASVGERNLEIADVQFDSRKVEKGHLFVATVGTQVDGHSFIDKAIKQGASAILCERLPEDPTPGITFLQVENTQRELSQVVANWYARPADALTMIGITGTNGKSTSVTLMHRLFQSLGMRSGLISTIVNKVGEEEYPSTHTTPDPKQLHHLFAEMKETGCEYCFMEVSSHALDQHRVHGIDFHMAMFTNLTHDHLDYHQTFQEYLKAKKKLFDGLKSEAIALVNVDDKNGRVMVQNTSAKITTFGLKRMADYRAKVLENTFEGLLMDIEEMETWFQLLGHFNAYNLLMVYAASRELGLGKQEVLMALSALERVDGRFEVLRDTSRGIAGIVDYAHTPDALKNVLSTLQDILKNSGKIVTVVGCGGDRDRQKRPVMAKIASDLSGQVILTSDNPRSENPHQILEEMWEGIPVSARRGVLKIENRREAIRTASQLVQRGDVILVAGKGHETYQEIEGVRHPFDDREVLRETFHS
ncbi:MAG: UDP-N-acetylmuramoyl-L-alanyl-D-glutamate--2,6-diaminopimelate ligase [Bacteroidota bacterium]